MEELKRFYRLEKLGTTDAFLRNSGVNGNMPFYSASCFAEIVPPLKSGDRRGAKITGIPETEEGNKKREELEDALNLKRGELKPTSTYWDNFYINVYPDGITFDTERPVDELSVRFLKAWKNKVVQGNQKKYPQSAEFILYSEEETVQQELKEKKRKVKAVEAVESRTHEEQAELLSMVESVKVKGLSTDVITNRLYTSAEQDPNRIIDAINDPAYKDKVLLNKAINEDILNRQASGIYYNDSGELFASNMKEAIDILRSEENQDIKISLQSRLGMNKSKPGPKKGTQTKKEEQ